MKKYHLVAANLVLLLLTWLFLASPLDERNLKPFMAFIFLLDAAMTNIALVG